MEVGTGRLLALMVMSTALGALILYFSNFRRSGRFARIDTRGEAFAGAIISYAVAIVASAAALWFFGDLEGIGPGFAFAQIVVLSLPAAIGASAGRLLLQS